MQIETIEDWNRTQLVPIRLINVSENGYRTPKSLIEKGMCTCNSCGAINSVDRGSCKECKEERFILIEK